MSLMEDITVENYNNSYLIKLRKWHIFYLIDPQKIWAFV